MVIWEVDLHLSVVSVALTAHQSLAIAEREVKKQAECEKVLITKVPTTKVPAAEVPTTKCQRKC